MISLPAKLSPSKLLFSTSSKVASFLVLSLAFASLSAAQEATPAPTTAASSGAFDLAASVERGKAVYMQTCIACHQITGLGIPPAFPPLAQTEYTTGSSRRMIAMLIKGVQGSLKVKDVTYNSVMIAVDTQFPLLKDDAKLADVINYARNSFGNKDEQGVTPETVAAVRKEFADRTTPWAEADLLSFPEPAK